MSMIFVFIYSMYLALGFSLLISYEMCSMYPKLCQSSLFDLLLIDCLRLVEEKINES